MAGKWEVCVAKVIYDRKLKSRNSRLGSEGSNHTSEDGSKSSLVGTLKRTMSLGRLTRKRNKPPTATATRAEEHSL
ncbi:hypothetical protein ACOMHN_004587 [Nucella lapillus]